MLQGQRLDTLSSLKQLFPDTGWDWGQQNDAEEFFIRALANSVHSSFLAGMANELFCGTVRTFYRFHPCLHTRPNQPTPTRQSLTWADGSSLTFTTTQTVIDREFGVWSEVEDGIDSCPCPGPTTRRDLGCFFESAPQHFTLVVRRNGFGARNTFRITAERVVQLPVLRTESHTTERVPYTLGGVVLHTGSHRAGHYRALVREPDGRWYLYDDDQVWPQHGEQEQVFQPLGAASSICILRYDRG